MIDWIKRELNARFPRLNKPRAKGYDHQRGWGPWRLETGPHEPQLVHGHIRVPLDTCLDPARVLDWIMVIADRPAAECDDQALSGFIRALDDLLHPRANLCSGGEAKRLNREQIDDLLRQRTQLLWNGQR